MKTPKLFTLAACAFACVLATETANATLITGGISYAGGYTPQNSSAQTVDIFAATQLAFTNPGVVTSVSGSFATFGVVAFSTPVTMGTPLIINPPTGLSPLYTVGAFTFNLTSMNTPIDGWSGPHTTNFETVTISGTGTFAAIPADNLAATSGTWSATFNQASGTYSFSASSAGVGVPDNGSTICLLGLALGGIAFVARRRLALS